MRVVQPRTNKRGGPGGGGGGGGMEQVSCYLPLRRGVGGTSIPPWIMM